MKELTTEEISMKFFPLVLFIIMAGIASAKPPKQKAGDPQVPSFAGTEQINLAGATCTIEVTTTYKSGNKDKEEYRVQAANKEDCSASAAPFKQIKFPEEIANKNVVPRWKGK